MYSDSRLNLEKIKVDLYNSSLTNYVGKEKSYNDTRALILNINAMKKNRKPIGNYDGNLNFRYYGKEGDDAFFDVDQEIEVSILPYNSTFDIIVTGYYSDSGAISDIAVIEMPNERNIDINPTISDPNNPYDFTKRIYI